MLLKNGLNLTPTIFKEKPSAFENKILNLKPTIKQVVWQQPCET